MDVSNSKSEKVNRIEYKHVELWNGSSLRYA